ncbi:rRNA biogenesis protein [Yarrowia sp. C11]|nr:rRNA biogenesis protein [Yarrowia sp. C11]KAG5371045.1 rRNA biogenesis protein [Yarrowia sp. E02]
MKRKHSEVSEKTKSEKPEYKSNLKMEDGAFPRGGAGVLSAMEIRQTADEAAKDLFEETQAAKSSKKKGGKKSKRVVTSDIVTIQSLSLDNISVGSVLLGRIVNIQSTDCVVSLPNNLHGFVSAVQVSEALNAKIDEGEEFDLTDYVSEGQWVRAAVVDTSGKRLALSLLPKDVNKDIADTDIDTNMALQVEVKSKEDKGYVVATGIKGKKGFIKSTDVELNKGQIVLASVVRISGRTITLDTEHSGEAVRQLEDFSSAVAGTPVTIVTTDKRNNGAVVSVFGSVDATIDPFQGSFGLEEKTSSVARVVATLDRGASGKRMLLSALHHVVNLEDAEPRIGEAFLPGQILDVKVTHVVQHGLFVDLAENIPGFIHISKLADKKTDSTADYEVGQTIKARIIAFAPQDEMYVLSCEESVMESKYLATTDLSAGDKIEGTVTKHLPKGGLIVSLSSFISAVVPASHLVDTKMANPELKFKIGSKVKGRVLGVDGNGCRMTIKKSLYNLPKDDFISYASEIGDTGSGTIVNVKPGGCVVEFWDNSQAWLPAGEISEAFIADISKHCRVGQTVKIRVLDINPEKQTMQVSCKLSKVASEHVSTAYENLSPGDLVTGKIIDKRGDFVIEMTVGDVDLTGIVPRNLLPPVHKKLRVGDKLECVVLAKQPWMNSMTLGAHPDIIKGYHNKSLIKETPSVGQAVTGWVQNVNQHGVFVSFAGVVGLAPQASLSDSYEKFQVVKGRVTSVNGDKFAVSIGKSLNGPAVNPVDPSISTIADYTEGKKTEGIVTAVLPSFVSVRLADNQNGRISLSQLETPVEKDDKISVTVLGPSSQGDQIELATNDVRLALNDIEEDKTYPGVVVQSTADSIWVALSAYIVGRLDRADLQEDDFEDSVGDLVEVAVCGVEGEKVKLRGAESEEKSEGFSDEALPVSNGLEGAQVTARVKRIDVDSVLCTINVNGKSSSAVASLVDAVDDYSLKLSNVFDIGETVPAVICSAKEPYTISIRKNQGGVDPLPSLPIKRGDKVKGVITNIAAGVFVAIGHGITARVKITNLSDSFLMDWKKYFKVGQIVSGRVMGFSDKGLPDLSLKQRHMTGDKLIEGPQDLVVGQKYDGSVQRTTEYGVFVNIGDATGLCHRSEIADTPVADCSELFNTGDKVRVIVLKIEGNKVSLGMKAAYFEGDEDEDDEEDSDVDMEVEDDDDDDDDDDEDEDDSEDEDSEDDSEDDSAPTIRSAKAQKKTKSDAMDVGFDWSGDVFGKEEEQNGSDDDSDDESDEEDDAPKSRKKRKTQIADITADLSTATPQSVGDYERLLVGNPNSSVLWISYMSFVMQLSELEKAREIAQRALKTISYRDEDEKLNVWLALLNLENTFGTPESTDKTFKDAAQYMDAETIYMKMADIYAASDKNDKADEVYAKAVKKFSGSMEAWIKYATFLFDNNQADKGRVLLDRATKALPKRDHLQCAIKFAQLEYKSGDAERGRTLLEGLVSVYPKRTDLWSQFVDFEIKYGQDKAKIEALFERVVALPKLSLKQAKFFFKKWYQYEVESDDDKAAEYVKAKAADYVTQRTKEEDDDEEEDDE